MTCVLPSFARWLSAMRRLKKKRMKKCWKNWACPIPTHFNPVMILVLSWPKRFLTVSDVVRCGGFGCQILRANLDGLLDYGEDFTDSATVVDNLQTAYQVGKGMLKHVEELAQQAEAKEADTPEDQEEPASSEDSEPVADVAFVEDNDDAQDEEPQAYHYAFEDDHDDHEVTPRRRMRFAFDPGAGAQA